MEKIAPAQGRGRTPRGDLQAESGGPPWRPLGPRGRKGLGVRGAPAPALQRWNWGHPQSWTQAECRYGGGRMGSPGRPRGGEWAGLPSLHCRLRGPDPPEEAGANQSQMWEQHKKMLIILTRKSPGQRNNEVTGAMGAGGDRRHEGATCLPCRQPAALGSLPLPRGVRLHMWGKPPPGRGGWGSGPPCRFSQGAEHPDTSRAGRWGRGWKWSKLPGVGGAPRESQRGSGRGWAPLSGRGSVWVTKLRQERTGAHVGLTGLLGAGATRGLHPGSSTAGKQGARECRPRAGWKAPPQASPPTRPWPQRRSQAPKGAGWGDIPTQASAVDPAPLPTACRDFQRLINNLGGGVAGPACRETFQAKLPTPQSSGNTHAELPRANRTCEVHSRTQRSVARP